jgi:BNR repeat-containing family member
MVRFWKPLTLTAFAVAFLGNQTSVRSAEYPKTGASCATLATQGIWTWYQDSRAVYYKGTHEKTYVGYFGSSNNPGAAAIASYDHATGEIDTFYLKTNWGFDDHNTTAVHLLPNGHIITFYSEHNGGAWFTRTSTNPEDITSWGPELKVNVGCTYPNVCQLSAEGANGNRLYVFYRGPSTQTGDFGMPYYQTSDDGGATWSAAVRYFFGGTSSVGGGIRPYCKYVSNGKDKFYMLIEGDNRNNPPPKPTYFMYYYNGGFYKMNGTLIETVAQDKSSPITTAQPDTVYDPANPPDGLKGTIGTGWDIALDSAGYPVFVYDIYDPSGANHRYYYYRWDGTKWNHHFLINSGGPMSEGTEMGFGGGLALDHANTNVVYLSTHVNGVFELERWITADKGATWRTWQITSGSAAKNCRPIVPRNTPGGKIDVVWNYGTYTTWGGPFSMDVKMYTFDSTKISSGGTPIKTSFERRAPKEAGFNLLVSGPSFTLVSPASSTLRIYNLEGRMVSDLTFSVRRMQAGVNAVQYKSVGLTRGMYIARLFDGAQNYSQSFVVER